MPSVGSSSVVGAGDRPASSVSETAHDGRMKAAVRHRYGSPDAVELVDLEQPVPTEDRIVVQVRAASVNRADLDALAPRPQFARLFIGIRRPRIPRLGIDVAGIVTAVGPGVMRFKVGD